MQRKHDNMFVVSAIFLLLIFLAGCDPSESTVESESGQSKIEAVKVSVITMEPTPIRDIVVLPGETEAWQDVRLASDTDGVVESLGPEEGQEVKQRQLIAKIQVSALKAALDRAEASFKLADELYERRNMLFERQVIAAEELDRSRTERALALSSLQQARVEYERGFVYSPIKGVVNHLHVDVGEYVSRGAPVADVVNVEKIKINVNVPEMDVHYLRVGQEAVVRVDALPDRRLVGTIDFVAYKADPATKTFQTRVLIDNLERDIRPGMIARVAFLRRIVPNAVVAPLSALVDKGGERIVFVEKDGVAHARTVSIGVLEGDRVEITGGLEPGDHLIVTGQTEVEEGTRVVASLAEVDRKLDVQLP